MMGFRRVKKGGGYPAKQLHRTKLKAKKGSPRQSWGTEILGGGGGYAVWEYGGKQADNARDVFRQFRKIFSRR